MIFQQPCNLTVLVFFGGFGGKMPGNYDPKMASDDDK